jgi:hypothetical protein
MGTARWSGASFGLTRPRAPRFKLTVIADMDPSKLIAAERTGSGSQESPRATKIYDQTKERLTQDKVDRIRLWSTNPMWSQP